MVMADANTMIRCIVGDDEQKIMDFQKVRSAQKVIYTLEVIAEVVYVLTKVYKVPRKEVSIVVQQFLRARNIVCVNAQIAIRSLQLFAENRLDFVDNILLAYHQIQGIKIYSYDHKLMNAINRGDIEQTSV